MTSDQEKYKIIKVVEKVLEKNVEIYSANWDFRNIIVQIPIFGPAIDSIATTLASEFQKKRISQVVTNLYDLIMLIDEHKIEKAFFETEEFYNLVIRFFETCNRSRYNEKIRLYCKILIGASLQDNKSERHSAEDFLILLSELTITDIIVAREIYEQQKNVPEEFDIEKEKTELKFIVNSGWHTIKDKCLVSEVDFRMSLTKLSRAGLVKEIVGMYIGYTGGLYIITPTFKELMKLIQFANEPLFPYTIE